MQVVGVRTNFFFQAEDGIRASPVTGVQTCALPISGCHTGNTTCFFTKLENTPDFKLADNGSGILDELFDVIKDRKVSLPEDSYTTELFIKGIDQIGQKVIEEAGETVIAGVKKDNEAMVREAADLLYHLYGRTWAAHT